MCFFVGSAYQPNRDAAEFIFRLASEARQKGGSEVVFVVAGACMERRREDNFISLGPIESIALAAFYRHAALILTPLTEGTGSSVKSVEALAHGAAVLSSSIGMRGIPVEDGVNCFIEDRREIYLDRIGALLAAPERLQSVRAGARALGARYDYRQVFAAYPLPPVKADSAETPPDPSLRFIELLPRAQKLNNPRAVAFACGVERG
jgi:glycosyltransferase involved in cell wall biosynthesis